MSIITEALKKAELEKKLKHPPRKEVGQVPIQVMEDEVQNIFQPERGKSGLSVGFILSIFLILALAGGTIFFFVDYLVQKRSVIIVPTTVRAKENVAKSANVAGIEFSFDVKPAPREVTVTPVSKTPAKVQESPKSKFVLSGIIDDPQNPQAVVNNEIVEIGETVGGAKVIGIDPRGVTLEYQGRETRMDL